MPYSVFESTNMASTHFAERIFDCVATADVENGVFGHLDGLAEGERNIYKFVPGVVAGKPVVVVDQPAWTEDTSLTSNQAKDKFINKAGVPFRVRVVKKNDEFGITIDGVTATSQKAMAPGAFVTVDATTGKLVAAAAAAESPVFEAVVERKRIQGAKLVTTVREYGRENEIFECRVAVL